MRGTPQRGFASVIRAPENGQLLTPRHVLERDGSVSTTEQAERSKQHDKRGQHALSCRPIDLRINRRVGDHVLATHSRRPALQSCVADEVRSADRIGSSVVRTLLAMLRAAATLAAQAPQVGLIGPLPAAAPPSTFDVTEKTIVQLLAAQRIGTVTSHDLVEKYLARIKAYDQDGPRLTAMVALNPKALEQADALDAEPAGSADRCTASQSS
jgi:hypothetical protein